jgi:hypothetical protein
VDSDDEDAEARQELNEYVNDAENEPIEDATNKEKGDEAVTNKDEGNEAVTNKDDGDEANHAQILRTP